MRLRWFFLSPIVVQVASLRLEAIRSSPRYNTQLHCTDCWRSLPKPQTRVHRTPSHCCPARSSEVDTTDKSANGTYNVWCGRQFRRRIAPLESSGFCRSSSTRRVVELCNLNWFKLDSSANMLIIDITPWCNVSNQHNDYNRGCRSFNFG